MALSMFGGGKPVILKRGSSASEELEALELLRGTLPKRDEKRLEADIAALKAGIAGEERILYELENSHMDMFVIQDLFLEHEGLTAQIDFMVFTPQRHFILECKNLYGDIEVNGKGDFIRTFNGRKQGIYSPITQNRRHLDLVFQMVRSDRGTISNMLFDRDLHDIYRSLVVLANPKTVVRDRYAKKEVKDQLVRADQLVATIKAINGEKGAGNTKGFSSRIRKRAESFLEHSRPNPVDYAEKYRKLATEQAPVQTQSSQETTPGTVICPRCGAPMVLRTAKRGERAGRKFYGCSNYPSCRGIVNVE